MYNFHLDKINKILNDLSKVTPKQFELHSKASLEWFLKTIKKYLGNAYVNHEVFGKIPPEHSYYNGLTRPNNTVIGGCFIFNYYPKNANNISVLPYYDRYPIIFVLKHNNSSILGINLHYLPPKARIMLMYTIYENTIHQNKQRLLKFDYQNLIKKIGIAKPCIKRYLINNIKSIYRVDTTNWDLAITLPTQYFVRSSQNVVWKDSLDFDS